MERALLDKVSREKEQYDTQDYSIADCHEIIGQVDAFVNTFQAGNCFLFVNFGVRVFRQEQDRKVFCP